MHDNANNDYTTILGADAVFKGELTFEKGMRLHGRFEGKITTAGRVHVAKEAKLQADVEAGAIIVEGEVRGNLTAAERIEIKQTARCEGDLKAAKLTVEEGAVFTGHITVGPEAANHKPSTGIGGGLSVPRPLGQTSPAPAGVKQRN